MAREPKTEDGDNAAETPEQAADAGLERREDTPETGEDAISEAVEASAGDATGDSDSDAVEDAAEISDMPTEEAEVLPEEADEPSRATETPPTPVIVPVPAQPAARRGLSVVLGGVIAALIGAGALYVASTQDWISLGAPDIELLARIDSLETKLTEAGAALDAAETEIVALKAAEPDLSGVTSAIEGVSSAAAAAAGENAGAIAALTDRLNSTDERLQKIAVQQIPEAELPKAISDAYDAKLAGLLATIDERFTALQAGLETKLTEIETSQAAAAEAEAAAEATARMAEARAALAMVETALEDGTAFSAPLGTLAERGGVEVPAALSGAADEGIPSIGDLAEAFPAAARAALNQSAAAAVEDGSISRLQAFLRTQAGARSLAPREGDDPDAVLSRAEAAVGLGDLDGAIFELDGLPADGKAAMADWLTMAETRRAALTAAADLAAQLEQN